MSDPQAQPGPSNTPRSGAEWLARVKRATPNPIKNAIKRATGERTEAEAPAAGGGRRRYRQADAWTGDRFTFQADGRTHRCFFITGCYKSGTNWVQNILNLHPMVNCKGEFHFEALWRGYESFTAQPWFLASRPRLKEIATDSVQDIVRRMMYAKTRDKPGALWLGDRTPRKMVELLPGAPMVNIRRDGRDVMVSWNFHHLRVKSADRVWEGVRPLAERLLPEFRADPASFEKRGKGFLYDETWFRAHARIWGENVLHDLEAAPRLRERGTPLLELEYARMHADVSKARADLFGLLGLNEGEAAPLSTESKTLPGFREGAVTSFYRKGTTGEWREYFDERLVRWFKEEAGEALVRAGYEASGDW